MIAGLQAKVCQPYTVMTPVKRLEQGVLPATQRIAVTDPFEEYYCSSPLLLTGGLTTVHIGSSIMICQHCNQLAID
jgi:hypothetical protein